jgi:hypothetical protein
MQTEAGYAARWADRAATDAALELATAPHELVYNGRIDAIWRVRPDAVVELARPNHGRVELLEVYGDGTSAVVAASSRSLRRTAASACAYATGASLVVGVPAAMLTGSAAFSALAALSFLLFPLTFLLRGRSPVRPWVRARFGTDDDWADVPTGIHGEPETGSQVIALCTAAHRSTLHYQVVEGGSLEAVKRGKQVEVLRIDRSGETHVVETRPRRGFDLEKLRGTDVTWHEVVWVEPGD